ncbi:MAG: type II toxin-antitoxin system VapC family toxin [Pirellulaceae bacterium]|nr:type II toxin-antitoxin system VapC family toxin [Pirellulaceae bacterium]
MYVLDSDILSLIQAGHPRLGERRRQVDPASIATTIITRIEVLRARFDHLLKADTGEELQRAQQWLIRSEELLSQVAVFPVDASAAAEFDRLRQVKTLRKIGRADLLIASIALSRQATLVTRNLRHFRLIPGLRVENWVN